MTIETKYNIGDEVVFIQENAIHRGTIRNIAVRVRSNDYTDEQYEYYDINCYEKALSKTYKEVHESLIYRTKEELLKSL